MVQRRRLTLLLTAASTALAGLAVLSAPARATTPTCLGAPGQIQTWDQVFGATTATDAVCIAQGAHIVIPYQTTVTAGAVVLEGQLDAAGTSTFTSTTVNAGSLHVSGTAEVGPLALDGDGLLPLVVDPKSVVTGTTVALSGTNPIAELRVSGQATFSGACTVTEGIVRMLATGVFFCASMDVGPGVTVEGYGTVGASGGPSAHVSMTGVAIKVGDDDHPVGSPPGDLIIFGNLSVPTTDPLSTIQLAPWQAGGEQGLTRLSVSGSAAIDARIVVDDTRFGPAFQMPQDVVAVAAGQGPLTWTSHPLYTEHSGPAGGAWRVSGISSGDSSGQVDVAQCPPPATSPGPVTTAGTCDTTVLVPPAPVPTPSPTPPVVPPHVAVTALGLTPTFTRLKAKSPLVLYGKLTVDGVPLVHKRVTLVETSTGRTFGVGVATTDRSGDWKAVITFRKAGAFSAFSGSAVSRGVQVNRQA